MKGIILKTEEVKAILEGRKTQTRRIIKSQPPKNYGWGGWITSSTDKNDIGYAYWEKGISSHYAKPPYQVGDILYVRETWQLLPSGFDEMPPEMNYIYKATDKLSDECTKWRPSIYMPKEVARIFLKITAVRVEKGSEGWEWVYEFERVERGALDGRKNCSI